MTTRAIDGWQGFVAFVGITIGVIPLIMTAFGAGSGLWGLVLDDTAGALRWICPLLVLAAGVTAIAALERRKRSSA